MLHKIIATRGKCAPTALAARPVFKVGEDHDPWFPIEERGPVARNLARRACLGCPVMTECLTLALREERHLGAAVYGVRGGLSAEDRLALRDQDRAIEGGTQ